MNLLKTPPFCDLLRKLRERRGFTLESLATSTGLSMGLLSKLERNDRKPTEEVMEKVLDVLKPNGVEKGALMSAMADILNWIHIDLKQNPHGHDVAYMFARRFTDLTMPQFELIYWAIKSDPRTVKHFLKAAREVDLIAEKDASRLAVWPDVRGAVHKAVKSKRGS